MLVFVSCSLRLSNRVIIVDTVSFFWGCNTLGKLIMLGPSSAARAVRSRTRTATRGVRVLLESSVALVLLGVAAAAAECSCARVLVTVWPQDMRTRCVHLVHIW